MLIDLGTRASELGSGTSGISPGASDIGSRAIRLSLEASELASGPSEPDP